jgi:DUF917 family protein
MHKLCVQSVEDIALGAAVLGTGGDGSNDVMKTFFLVLWKVLLAG